MQIDDSSPTQLDVKPILGDGGMRPPVLLELTLSALVKFASEFQRYELLGGTRKIPTLFGADILPEVFAAIDSFSALSSTSQIKALFHFLRPVTVHGALDHLASLRMFRKDTVDIGAVSKYISTFTQYIATLTTLPADSLLLDVFIVGLQPLRLRDRVRDTLPSSLSVAVAVTRVEAAALLHCQQESRSMSYERPRTDRYEGRRTSDHRGSDRRPTHPSPRGLSTPLQDPPRPRPPAPQDLPPTGRGPVICHNCNEAGHIRPNCPLLTARDVSSPVAAHTRSRATRPNQPSDRRATAAPVTSRSAEINAIAATSVITPASHQDALAPIRKPEDFSFVPDAVADHWIDYPSPLLPIIFCGPNSYLGASALLDSGANVLCVPTSMLPALRDIGCIPYKFKSPKSIRAPGQPSDTLVYEYLFAWVQVGPKLQLPLTFYVLDCRSILFPFLLAGCANKRKS